MVQYLPIVELRDLDGNNGFQVNGATPGDKSGSSVAFAGDVNGDGFDDVIIGAPYTRYAFADGGSYIVFGNDTGFDAVLELASLDGNDGFKIDGDPAHSHCGWSVSSAGDVDGDGFDDVVIGALGYPGINSSASYVVFGNGAFGAEFDLSDLDGDNGFLIEPADYDNQSGACVSSAGDVNGDGFADVIVGTYRFDIDGSYVVFGKASGFGATFGLAGIDGNNGFHITGAANGFSASSGDVNGDGFSDVVLGAFGGEGRTYVVLGKTSGFGATFDLSTLDGNNGFQIHGETTGDYSSWSVSSGGDVNADGFEDTIVGALGADPNGEHSGAAYVVFGKASGFDATIELSALDGNNGFQINGAAAGDECGASVSSAGDVNGDGFGDVIVGATGADPHGDHEAGETYVVFGKASGFAAEFEVSSLDGNNGFQINGEGPRSGSGLAVSAADINSDGFADLVVGSTFESTYVTFGSMPDEAVTRTGTAIGNIIHGGDFNDILRGLGGGDSLLGHGGNDSIRAAGGSDILDGAGGDDTLRGGSGKDTLDGGSGTDVLNGGASRDVLIGGSGADTFVFGAGSDSTGVNADTVRSADFAADMFDLTSTVAGIDATIGTGLLRKGQFDADLAAAADAAHLGADHAVVFTPDAGNQAGKTFIVVDMNGIAGYDAGVDLVIVLPNAVNLASLGTEDFI